MESNKEEVSNLKDPVVNVSGNVNVYENKYFKYKLKYLILKEFVEKEYGNEELITSFGKKRKGEDFNHVDNTLECNNEIKNISNNDNIDRFINCIIKKSKNKPLDMVKINKRKSIYKKMYKKNHKYYLDIILIVFLDYDPQYVLDFGKRKLPRSLRPNLYNKILERNNEDGFTLIREEIDRCGGLENYAKCKIKL